MAKVSVTDIEDVFGIPRDGSNINDDQDDFDLSGTEARIPFEEKAKDVEKDIASLPSVPLASVPLASVPLANQSQETPSPTVQATQVQISMPTEEVKKPKVEKMAKNKLFGDLFDDDKEEIKKELPVEVKKKEVEKSESVIVKEEKSEVTLADKDNVVAEEKPANETKDVVQEDNSVSPDIKAQTQSDLNTEPLKLDLSDRWQLVSPSPLYDKLYEEKRWFLSNTLRRHGELPFDDFYTEIEAVNVDTNVPSWDTEEVGRRIAEVQRWRDRMRYIQIRVNAQYFPWKRFMDLPATELI